MKVHTVYFKMSNELWGYKKKNSCRFGENIQECDFSKYLSALENHVNEAQRLRGFQFNRTIHGDLASDSKFKKWSGTLDQRNPAERESVWTKTMDKIPPLEYVRPPTANSDGQIELESFCTAFLDGESPGLLNGIALPIFAVVDHNSAHHMAYILARKAFSLFSRQRGNKIVINFDNHADGIKATGGKIQCKSWAWNLLKDKIADVYVSLGAWKQSLPRLKPGETQGYILETSNTFSIDKLPKEPENIKQGIESIMAEVETKVRGKISSFSWQDADVCITVDRDFMKGSFTPYGDGEYSPEVGRAAVTNCLGFLCKKNASLVGFDITGLPSTCGSSAFKGERKAAYDQAVEDIAIFYRHVMQYCEPIQTTLTETVRR